MLWIYTEHIEGPQGCFFGAKHHDIVDHLPLKPADQNDSKSQVSGQLIHF